MRTLELDKNNNLVIEGDIGILKDLDALAQDIKTMIGLHVKEYAYNTSLGIDWIRYLQTNDSQLLLAEIEKRVYSDSRVASATITTTKEGNALIININTTSGQEVSVNVGGN